MRDTDIVGLIPCAGNATRLGVLPFSKELYPIGFDNFLGSKCVKVVSSYLIEHMLDAGVKEFHMILKEGKEDIANYYSKIKKPDMHFKYHIAMVDYGVPFSLNTAYPYIKDKIVCLGFPDILFKPKKVFRQLVEKLVSNPVTSIVLGVMPFDRPEKADMIEFESDNIIKRIVIKSKTEKSLKYSWFCAVWNSTFSDFLNSYVTILSQEKSPEELRNCEVYIGDVIRAAMNNGIDIESVIFENGSYLDIGTPEDLKLAGSFFN